MFARIREIREKLSSGSGAGAVDVSSSASSPKVKLGLENEDLRRLKRNQAIVDAAFDPMFIVDSSGTIVMANDAAVAQFEWSREEFIGSNIKMICGGSHADRHDIYMKRYLETGEKHIIGTQREVPAKRKDGSEFPVQLGIKEIKEGEGGERYFCGYTRDLTHQKRQEHEIQLRQSLVQGMINSSFDPMISINEHGIIHVVNQSAVTMFGWSQEEFIGSNISMICGGGHGARHDEYIARYLRTGEKRIMGQRRHVTARRKDGTEFEVELGITEVEVTPQSGNGRMFCGYVRDLTRQILDQKTMLQQETAMMDAFFGNACTPAEKSAAQNLITTPPLTPPSPPHRAFSSPRSPRSPRLERSKSLGKHTMPKALLFRPPSEL